MRAFCMISLAVVMVAGSRQPLTPCETQADCPDGLGCGPLPLVEGAATYCYNANPAGTPYHCPLDGPNQCCEDADCKQGGDNVTCTSWPQVSCGPPPPRSNMCEENLCDVGNPCTETNRTCVPGIFAYSIRNTCAPAWCTGPGSCPIAGSKCLPFSDPTCDALQGFFCAPPGSPCTADADCPDREICTYNVASAKPQCVMWYPPPVRGPD